MNQDIPLTPLGTIGYDDAGIVIWHPADKNAPMNPVQCNDVLLFSFLGPGTVQEAVIMIGPRSPTTLPSPFNEQNPIVLTKTTGDDPAFDYFYSPPIAAEAGLWGFSVSFVTRDPIAAAAADTPTVTKFYFLPDPELAVGSGIDLPD